LLIGSPQFVCYGFSIPDCFCFDMYHHKFWEENRGGKKKNIYIYIMVWSCHPWLQLNHTVQKTEAKKVADLRKTTLMQNHKFHSGSSVPSYFMGLRMLV
jgi:hypothetical protein